VTTQAELAKNQQIRSSNTEKMFKTLGYATKKIVQQGDGCYNEQGACYYNPVTKHKDIIAHLSTIPVQFLKKPFRTISDDDARPILTNVLRTQKFNVERYSERVRCTEFLRELQDAHDSAFDPYNKVSNRMDTFLVSIETIRSNLK
jgi:hypothetical protein